MTPKRWLNMILSSAAIAAIGIVPQFAAAQPAAAPAGDSAAEIAAREIEQQRTMLLGDGATTQADRDESARRLLQSRASNARAGDALSEGIRGTRAESQLAVARALAEVNSPPAEFLDDLIRLLPARNERTPEMVDAAAQAIANYKDRPDGPARLREFVFQGLVPERLRLPAVRALGTLNDKSTAEVLMRLLRRSESQLVANTAAAALADMTGRTEFGNDVSQWSAWWNQQSNKPDAVFREERIADRFGDLRIKARAADDASAAFERAMIDSIRYIPAGKERDQFTLDRLRDPSPVSRTAGTALVVHRVNNGEQLDPQTLAQLRTLIGDSNSAVRRRVAQAIQSINDPAAVRPILAQLQREDVTAVKAALIEALAPAKDLTAVPELTKLLADNRTPFQVAESCASTLAAMGREIAANTDLATEAANVLSGALIRTTEREGSLRLREKVVQAMIPLRNPGLIPLLLPIPGKPESNTPSTRIYAIRALAEMQFPQRQAAIAESIAGVLSRDRDPGVRLEAAKNLGIVGATTADASALFEAMNSQTADAEIRNAAWASLSSLMTKFDWSTVNDWVNVLSDPKRFPNPEDYDPSKERAARLVLNEKLIPVGGQRADLLAVNREKLGVLNLHPKINEPDKAIPFLLLALDYNDRIPGGRVEEMQGYLLDAYLRSGRVKDAVNFANNRIIVNRANEETMARAIVRQVEEFREQKKYDPAISLLDEVKRLNLTPDTRYHQAIVNLDKDVRAIKNKTVPYLHDLYPPFRRNLYA